MIEMMMDLVHDIWQCKKGPKSERNHKNLNFLYSLANFISISFILVRSLDK